jgi:hypothetical protein
MLLIFKCLDKLLIIGKAWKLLIKPLCCYNILLLLFYTTLHLIISCMHHVKMRSCLHMPYHVEPESEEPMEPTPIEETNPELNQDKPSAFHHHP